MYLRTGRVEEKRLLRCLEGLKGRAENYLGLGQKKG